jgi:hypothetical protein
MVEIPSPNSNYGQLEKKIIHLLTDGSALSVNEIQTRLGAVGAVYSVQAIYHVFRKLRRQGVILKVSNRFSLGLNWALDLLDLARQIESKLMQSVPINQVLPAPNQQLSWSFAGLLALDDFWVQLMLILFERSSEKRMYNFCQHPWFYYAQQSKLEKFYRVLTRRQSKVYLVIGGHSYLDQEFSRNVSKQLYCCSHASGKQVGGTTYLHVMVIGEYVIKVRLPKRIGDEIDNAFHTAQNKTVPTLLSLQRIISQQTHARLSVVHNSRLAAKLCKRFEALFR